MFETALRNGYAVMHPNCRHEFIPTWLELLDDEELKREIEKSKISAVDTRSQQERNAYAKWQADNRAYNHEKLYFEKAKRLMGKDFPYSDIGAFRRSYHATKGSNAYNRSHRLIADYKEFLAQKGSGIKSFAKFRDIKYNKPTGAKSVSKLDEQPHGKIRYPAIRKNKYDVGKIAKNVGIPEEEVAAVKQYLFLDKHDLGGAELEYFAPDDEIAKSWDRLTQGTDIRTQDLVFLNHELLERKLVAQGYSQQEAHDMANKKYNFKAAIENAKNKKP